MRTTPPPAARRTVPALLIAAVLAAFAASCGLGVAPARAQDLLPPKSLDRRFPQFLFCPLPISIPFVADGSNVEIQFKGNVFGTDGSGNVQFAGQAIDDVALCSTSDFAANSGFPPASGTASFCYLDDPVQAFFFNRSGLSLPLLELFDTDPVTRGWDMSHGGYFVSDNSAPRNPETDTDFTGGSLGLGQDIAGGSDADTAQTSIVVSGLSNGHSYTLTAWWYVTNVPTDNSGNSKVTLVVRVLGETQTPIAQRSWGALKSRYR